MQFTSMAFLASFTALFFVYWALPHKWRWVLCLGASLGFYGLFGLPMLGVLCTCIGVSYGLGRFVAARSKSRFALGAAIALALLPLLTFKYWGFVAGAFGFSETLSLLSPVGISFFTFKIIAYLVECWRGTLPAQVHFGKYALYVSFFPQIASGPIQRPKDLLGQLDTSQSFSTHKAVVAAQTVLLGLFLKLVLADNLAGPVQSAFAQPQNMNGPALVLAAALYSAQLYCDFAGYSYLANGCMGLLGFAPPENFCSPYCAISMQDFWARWHITLSSFLRDYVYFPLGGSRKGTLRTYLNLMLTFFISGLWHGTGLQFLVWGSLHGVFQVFGRLTAPARSRLWTQAHISPHSPFARGVKMCIVFCLVTAAWVFFGAKDLPTALQIFAGMPQHIFSLTAWNAGLTLLGLTPTLLWRMGIGVAVLYGLDLCCKANGFGCWISARKPCVQILLCYFFLMAAILLAPATGGGFIYFNF